MDNTQKLEYIVRHYCKLMQSAANRILNDHYEAEDACQETLLKLCRALDNIDDVTTASARAYCIASVKNTACDMIRKNKRIIPVEKIFDDKEVSAVYDNYPSETDSLVEDIRELPEIYCNIIKMRCLEKKSPGQIAVELHLNVSTINSRLSRARELLRKKWIFQLDSVSFL